MSAFELFPIWRPGALHRPRFAGAAAGVAGAAGHGGVRLRWLGTACWVLETDTTTVVIDPFVSRPRATRVVFRKLVPDIVEIARRFPRKVDAVVCGHSHYDHVMDGPALAAATGARFIGSRTAIHLARAAGLPESQLTVATRVGTHVRIGDVEIQFVPSLHGRFLFRRFYLADGELTEPPTLPAHASAYKMGGAFGVIVRTKGVTVYHNGSADLIDAELGNARADVLLVGLAGRKGTRDYLGRLIRALEPALVIPTHHDAFFSPLDEVLRLLPGIDLDGFASEVHALASRATVLLPMFEETIVVPPGDARGAGVQATTP